MPARRGSRRSSSAPTLVSELPATESSPSTSPNRGGSSTTPRDLPATLQACEEALANAGLRAKTYNDRITPSARRPSLEPVPPPSDPHASSGRLPHRGALRGAAQPGRRPRIVADGLGRRVYFSWTKVEGSSQRRRGSRQAERGISVRNRRLWSSGAHRRTVHGRILRRTADVFDIRELDWSTRCSTSFSYPAVLPECIRPADARRHRITFRRRLHPDLGVAGDKRPRSRSGMLSMPDDR